MLTHGSIIANLSAVMYQFGRATLRKDDIMISYLPLAHMFERNCQVGRVEQAEYTDNDYSILERRLHGGRCCGILFGRRQELVVRYEDCQANTDAR